jgi:hypothetical protein
MKWDYYKGDLNKPSLSRGGFNKKEDEVRGLIIKAFEKDGINAEKTFFGVIVYHEGKGFKLVLREDY